MGHHGLLEGLRNNAGRLIQDWIGIPIATGHGHRGLGLLLAPGIHTHARQRSGGGGGCSGHIVDTIARAFRGATGSRPLFGRRPLMQGNALMPGQQIAAREGSSAVANKGLLLGVCIMSGTLDCAAADRRLTGGKR